MFISLAAPGYDADAVFRRQIQRLARLYLEGLIPRVKIARDPSPLDRRRMRIGGDALRQILLAIVAPPHLRPAEEEALVAGRAVDHRRFLTAQRSEERRVGKEGVSPGRNRGSRCH